MHMNDSVKDKTEYLIIFVNEFARRYQLTAKQAFRYLSRYKAIDFLCNQYNVAHTQSFDSMVEDMATYCRRFGGAIAWFFIAIMDDIEYMNECMARDLAVMLVEDYQISIPEALDILYNSETYEKLQDERTGLYFQSPVYVYDFLQQELKNGKIA